MSYTTETIQTGYQIPPSRVQFMRRVQSIGSEGSFKLEGQQNHFMKLKKEKRIKMGKIFRNAANEVELFGLRDENATDKFKPPMSIYSPLQDMDYEGGPDSSQIIHYSSQVEQFAYFNNIQCNKCHGSLTKIAVPSMDPNRTISLSIPKVQSMDRMPVLHPPQKKLMPHEPLRRKDLPPIVFQAHLPVPSIAMSQKHFTTETVPIDGHLRFGRIAEGIDEDKLNFLSQQKKMSFVKVGRGQKPLSHNLAITKVNRIKTYGCGNVLGKAMQGLHMKLYNQLTIPKSMERSVIKDKERQIDELIFGRSTDKRAFVTEQQIDMKDFI